jgi:hypothetical protein
VSNALDERHSADHSAECLTINAVTDLPAENPEPRTPPFVAPRPPYEISLPVRDDVVVTSSFLPGEQPKASDLWPVLGIECKGELSYWHGLASVWPTDKIIVNVERDMEFSDELVAELAECREPLCTYPYKVYPSKLGRFIYCATAREPSHEDIDPHWIQPGDDEAVWSSIGFCKIAPEARVKPLDAMFWKWLEHSVNRCVCQLGGFVWHIHWPEIRHEHDYSVTPDHLW